MNNKDQLTKANERERLETRSMMVLADFDAHFTMTAPCLEKELI